PRCQPAGPHLHGISDLPEWRPSQVLGLGARGVRPEEGGEILSDRRRMADGGREYRGPEPAIACYDHVRKRRTAEAAGCETAFRPSDHETGRCAGRAAGRNALLRLVATRVRGKSQ